MPEEVNIKVTRDTLAGTLCCAFEGGSNYWYMIEEFIKPENISDELDAFWHDAPHIAYPLSDGGGVIISDRDDPDAPHHTTS